MIGQFWAIEYLKKKVVLIRFLQQRNNLSAGSFCISPNSMLSGMETKMSFKNSD